MSFLGAIANLGLMGTGYEKADAQIAARERRDLEAQLTKRAVEEAIRKDDLGKGLRSAVAGVKSRAAMHGLEVPEHQGEAYDEEYRPASKEGFDIAADSNLAGKTRAAADYAAEQGELEQAEKFRAKLEKMEAEGYKSMMVDMAVGKNPQEIAAQFNRIGEKRIVDGSTDGKVYKFKYEDGTEQTYDRGEVAARAEQMGFLKKPQTKIVPQGSDVVGEDGKVLHTNPRPAPVRNIDPLSPEGIEAAKKRAAAIAAVRPTRGGDPTARRPGNANQFHSQLKSLATSYLTTNDEETGKPTVDRQGVVRLTAAASQIASANPNLSPAEALEQAAAAFDEERSAQATALEEAEEVSKTLAFESEKKRKDWVKATASAKAKMRTGASRTKAPAAEPGDGQAAPRAAKAGVAEPATEEDFKALPPGTRFVNPKDGRIYVKK